MNEIEIPQGQLQVLQTEADKGSSAARDWLNDLKPQTDPAKTPPEPKVEDGPTHEPTKVGEETVDKGHERNGKAKGPTKLDTIRELRRKRRELESALEKREEDFQKKLASMEDRLNSLQNRPQTPQQPEEDVLTQFLSNPKNFMEAYKRQILQEAERGTMERVTQLPLAMKKESERVQAFNALKSLDGFDAQDANAWDDLAELAAERTGLPVQYIEGLAENNPLSVVDMLKKAWISRNELPPKAQSDKAAAASSAASAAKPTVGPTTMDELNRLAIGLNPKTMDGKTVDDLWDQLGKTLNKK